MNQYSDNTISTGQIIRFPLSHYENRPTIVGNDLPEGILDNLLGKTLLSLAERAIEDTKSDEYGSQTGIQFKELISSNKELREIPWLYRINRIFYGDSIEGVELACEVIRYCKANNIL